MSEEQQSNAPQPDAVPETTDINVSATTETPMQETKTAEETGEIKVFGMSRSCFHGAALGVAAGFLVSGFSGVLFHINLNPSASVIICALLGYLIFSQLERRRSQKDSQDKS